MFIMQSSRQPLFKFSSSILYKQNVTKANQTICQCRLLSTFKKSVSQNKTPNLSMFRRPLSNSKAAARRGPVTWASLGVFLLTGAGIVFYVRKLKQEKQIEKEKELRKSIGKASIGGPFELVDTNGKAVSSKDFLGKWILIYFGFCHCPDICPDQLEKMTEIVNRIEKMASLPKLEPLFITVDPHRDTAEHIKEYLKDFHPRMIGLTGSDEQVKQVCRNYRVYYSAGPKDEDEDYIVDHTIIMYLVNPEGNFVDYYGQNRTVSEVSGAISTNMLKK